MDQKPGPSNNMAASSTCSMDDLPNEILSLIFDAFTSAPAAKDDEPASAALVLSHVCHRWKGTVTPSQWATIRVRHINHQKILNNILRRSRGHALDVAIRLGNIGANYYLSKDFDTMKTQWRILSLFNTLADYEFRLRCLTVEAKQAVLEWLEEVIITRPLTPTHLSLIQADKELHMHNFAQSCFNLSSCVSLTLVHTAIIPKQGQEWSSLKELRLLDIRSYELLGWTYNMEMDESGHYRWESKPETCFASVELLSISNTFFIRKEPQIFDFFSLFPNVRELELDCVDSHIILEVLAKEMLMPNLQRITVNGKE